MKNSNLNILRHELKYYINSLEADRLRNIFETLLLSDQHAVQEKDYKVSSLYFETYENDNLDEKLNGIFSRRKFRIRIYNKNLSNIKLERKLKKNNMIIKSSSVISEADCQKLLNLNFENLTNKTKTFLEIINHLRVFRYKPKVIVEYDREAYFLPYNNIRMTFDKNLSTYNNFTKINELRKANSFPIFDEKMITLEVKFSNELPLHIKEILSIIPASRASIGKYVLAQRFMNYDQWRDPLSTIF